MLCKVNDCGKEARYKAACLCQKHYFRVRRYGTTDTTRTGKGRDRYVTPSGYVYVRRPGHPLSISNGLVAEHRAVVYDDLGPGPMNCELCGLVVTWETVHIDHIDETTDNNVRSNLRPTCSVCNTRRGMTAPVEWKRTHKITFEGESKTPTEWARDPRVQVSGHQIVQRKAAGMSDHEALFAPKRTHNGNSKPRKRPYKPFIYYDHGGKSLTLSQWAREPGVFVSAIAIKQRLKKGWPLAEALFTPSTECAPRAVRTEQRAKAGALKVAA